MERGSARRVAGQAAARPTLASCHAPPGWAASHSIRTRLGGGRAMSWKALYRPAGRRGARVYWRRRLLAVGFLFVAVLAGVWAVARHGAPRPAGAPVYAVASPIQPSVSPSVPGSAAAAAPPVAPDGADTAAPGAQPSTPPQAQDARPAHDAGRTRSDGHGRASPGHLPGPGHNCACLTERAACHPGWGCVLRARGLRSRPGPCDVAGLTRTVQVANSAGPIWSSSRCGYPPTGPTVVRPGAPVTFSGDLEHPLLRAWQLRAGRFGRLRRHRAGGRRQWLRRDSHRELTTAS